MRVLEYMYAVLLLCIRIYANLCEVVCCYVTLYEFVCVMLIYVKLTLLCVCLCEFICFLLEFVCLYMNLFVFVRCWMGDRFLCA